jgi:glucose/arabinose dehydrogenase/PKD repeat protein
MGKAVAPIAVRTARIAAFLALLAPAASGQSLPANFTDVLVATVGSPTALAFTPDGRLLITTQGGTLRVYCSTNTLPGCSSAPATGGLLGTAALAFPTVGTSGGQKPAPICSNGERGLLGVAVDPGFATNRYVYLYYTRQSFDATGLGGQWMGCGTGGGSTPVPAFNPVNRASRFTFTAGTSAISGTSEVVLLDNMPSAAGNHNAGDLRFGRDGYLYVTIGDGGCDYAGDSGCGAANDASRDINVLTGKLLRIDPRGNPDPAMTSTPPFIPPSNPNASAGARCNLTGSTTGGTACQETYGRGFRNPFRFATDPNAPGTRIFVNDVGQDTWEEIDVLQAGADYGWNVREGPCPTGQRTPCSAAPAGMTDPVFSYAHGSTIPGTTLSSCGAISGGAFVPNGIWPSGSFDNAYLFADFNCGAIFRVAAAGSGPFTTAANFDTGLGVSSVTSLRFGPFQPAGGNPTQALYYATYGGGGQVRRVSYSVAGNHPPTAVASVSVPGGLLPFSPTFDATGSTDPDPGDVLTYFWDFGDGQTAQTTQLMIQHTYSTAGTVTVTLWARDDKFSFSAPVTLQVQPGNPPPQPSIASPAPGATFAVGQTLTLTGSASDVPDGTLPPSALSWKVLLHQGAQTALILSQTGNNLTFSAPAPASFTTTATGNLEVQLTATDSGGLRTTVTRTVQPRKVDLTFATVPPGLVVSVGGASLTGPQTVTSWEAWALGLGAAGQVGPDGRTYLFASWSDGGAASHTIVTPASPTTYTATFDLVPPIGPLDYFTLEPCRLLDTRTSAAYAAGSTHTIPASLGACGVPATARALALNLTATESTGNGHLRLQAADLPLPTTSTINFQTGQNRANNAVVRLDASARFLIYVGMASGSVHVVVDVVGYFQ